VFVLLDAAHTAAQRFVSDMSISRKCVNCFLPLDGTEFCTSCGNYRRPVSLEDAGDYLLITQSWRSQLVIVLLCVGAVVAAILSYVMRVQIAQAGLFSSGISWTICAIVAYLACSLMVNRTVVRITKDSIEMSHGPLPVKPKLFLPADEIQQLFVRSIKHMSGETVEYTFHLSVYTRAGKRCRLLRGLGSEAFKLEKVIEKFLNIEDEQVDPGFDFNNFLRIVIALMLLTAMGTAIAFMGN
jgi:hypothetical protein